MRLERGDSTGRSCCGRGIPGHSVSDGNGMLREGQLQAARAIVFIPTLLPVFAVLLPVRFTKYRTRVLLFGSVSFFIHVGSHGRTRFRTFFTTTFAFHLCLAAFFTSGVARRATFSPSSTSIATCDHCCTTSLSVQSPDHQQFTFEMNARIGSG